MRALILGATALALAAGPALASDRTEILGTIDKYAHAFNAGDKSGASLCEANASIIDDFPPHVWSGASACATWFGAVQANFRHAGITDGKVALGKSGHLTITGDVAYGVYPSVVSYRLKGKPVKDRGVWTFAMHKGATGWRIAAWTWSGL